MGLFEPAVMFSLMARVFGAILEDGFSLEAPTLKSVCLSRLLFFSRRGFLLCVALAVEEADFSLTEMHLPMLP